MKTYDLIIVGGGPAGMGAAIEAYKNGVKNILIIERENELGGILNQCIHNGFGVHYFGEELTGPEYAGRFIDMLRDTDIDVFLDTMVIEIEENKTIHAINPTQGYMILEAKSIILAMGCSERTRGAINIPGSRVSGVMTAGTAQKFINMEGYMPGKKVVILGSGDIGLIMARRMTLEGAKVDRVLEIMPYSNGLTRNIVQCLDDYDIPLYTSHTVVKIHGKERLTGITVAKVDEKLQPIKGTEVYVECDTLLLSVGLIPDNALSEKSGINLDSKTRGAIVNASRETNIPGIFACGNVLHVHDLVDFVTEEAAISGKGAAKYLKGKLNRSISLETEAGAGISYIVPQKISFENMDTAIRLYFRVKQVYDHHKCVISVNGEPIKSKKSAKFIPSEMISIELKKEQLENKNGVLSICMEEA